MKVQYTTVQTPTSQVNTPSELFAWVFVPYWLCCFLEGLPEVYPMYQIRTDSHVGNSALVTPQSSQSAFGTSIGPLTKEIMARVKRQVRQRVQPKRILSRVDPLRKVLPFFVGLLPNNPPCLLW